MAITCPRCGHQYDVTLFEFGQTVECKCGATVDLSQGHLLMKPEPADGVLIDIAGVLYVEEAPVAGAATALVRLEEANVPVRFLTNTTRATRVRLLARLQGMGLQADIASIFSAPVATRKYLEQRNLRPYLLVHPDLREEFAGLDTDQPNAVVVGDAADVFKYSTMNEAFRVLMDGGQLISMGSNRYFRDHDGLSLDMGPFVEALRYAAGIEPVVIGKPSPAFFQEALNDMGVSADKAVMIGDDLENDIGGAQALGIRGILVRTGKYRPEDGSDPNIKPGLIVDDFPVAVDEILKVKKTWIS
jgi:HAD superfamily hydrolase (TIGR01458 family)